MANQACHSIRDDLLAYVREQTEVLELRDTCVITLPIRTVDDRWVDVYIDKRAADFYLVHDAGKASAELVAQGINITDAKFLLLNQIAESFGASLSNGSFVVGCKVDKLQESIFSVAQCASLAMVEVLKHKPNYQDEPIVTMVSQSLTEWSRDRGKFKRRVAVKGATAQHIFDFVAYPGNARLNTVAINVLSPSYTPMITAQRYGFLALDLEKSLYAPWKRFAVLTKRDEWTPGAIDLLDMLTQRLLLVESDIEDASKLSDSVRQVVDELVAA